MKVLIPQLYHLLRDRPSRLQLYSLLRFLVILALLVASYSVLFHVIMEWEGQTEHSWLTGVYWTLTVMSTLGFGDITFTSDIGRVFSSVVLLSGIIFLLVLLPFTFIEFFYAPWLRAQASARAPGQLPEKTAGHVILTNLDEVTAPLIERLIKFQYPYVILVPDLTEALRLDNLGYHVMRAELDNPESYRAARVENALLVATTVNDRLNTNIAFTVREACSKVPIVATANVEASVDILQLAGCDVVLQLGKMMGDALARRVVGTDRLAHVIGVFDELQIAEALAQETDIVGKTLVESGLRQRVGLTVLGVWVRGQFQLAYPELRIENGMVLVLAGDEAAIDRYNAMYEGVVPSCAPVVIIGGGRVGRAIGEGLAARQIDYRIVETLPERVRDPAKYILGDAANLEILEEAGIRKTSTVLITTHDDDTNIYLTIYCRKLRPDMQIISRAKLERNVTTLHRAGADIVMSYASTGANAMINVLNRTNILMVAEGLDIFEVKTPHSLVGKNLIDADIRRTSGCTVVAISRKGETIVNPDPRLPLLREDELILIGSVDAENRFLDLYAKEIEA
ncbi:MAG: NAD-binding protein [Litorilinea sp.]